jgi:hypothetical protein
LKNSKHRSYHQNKKAFLVSKILSFVIEYLLSFIYHIFAGIQKHH